MPQLLVSDLGTMPYLEALHLQRAVARARISGEIAEDVLLLVEHPPVVTLGRSSKERHLLASPALLAQRGVELHETERGGDVTFHGPGQLVGYPIVDLKRHKQDLHWYLRQVEEAIIRGLAPLGITAGRSAGQTGVWTQGRKLASIGVHARDWVTWHGFALNVTTDLSFFDLIVPCGIAEVEMTSVERELGGEWEPSLLAARMRQCIVSGFADVLRLESSTLDPAELERVARAVSAT
ncbi:MAG TPA: lipoyl(octanoyl) transferase LipB [Gemmatimonadaceae bacterium]|jgi:lipoyl(octanoyl) transferase|nr:lipoyl(octanoyl) transferase LipB [Gemmatimonadaceae bacterium]